MRLVLDLHLSRNFSVKSLAKLVGACADLFEKYCTESVFNSGEIAAPVVEYLTEKHELTENKRMNIIKFRKA